MMRKAFGPSGIKTESFILKVKWEDKGFKRERQQGSFKMNRVLTGFRYLTHVFGGQTTDEMKICINLINNKICWRRRSVSIIHAVKAANER